jgi:uncharacterized protein YjbI with pentapeptide repeats
LVDANLAGANLAGANLTNANLKNADLTNTDLTGANLTGVILTDAVWYGSILTDVIGLRDDGNIIKQVQRFCRNGWKLI